MHQSADARMALDGVMLLVDPVELERQLAAGERHEARRGVDVPLVQRRAGKALTRLCGGAGGHARLPPIAASNRRPSPTRPRSNCSMLA